MQATARFELELQSAQEMVEVIKNSGTSAHAVLWWMERDLKEMEKTMSKKQFEGKQVPLARAAAARASCARGALPPPPPPRRPRHPPPAVPTCACGVVVHSRLWTGGVLWGTVPCPHQRQIQRKKAKADADMAAAQK